jgi:2-polyprenyl-3-methyl-5-hydroxy-6-metoxy-1,4-benzoquinol methylase
VGNATHVNRAYYEELSAGRDDYWRKMAAPRHRVSTFLAELARLRPGSVVDLGCGKGLLLEEIRRQLGSVDLVGVDLSAPQVEANRTAMPDIDWYAADLVADDLPEELSGRFEAVVASEIIEHVEDAEGFLANARRLARPGGELLLSTQSGPVRETERRVGHIRHFTREQMSELLEAAGWQPLQVWNTGYPFHDLSKWYANRDPDQTMSQFGERAYGWRENAVCWALRLAFKLNSRHRGAQLFAVARRP